MNAPIDPDITALTPPPEAEVAQVILTRMMEQYQSLVASYQAMWDREAEQGDEGVLGVWLSAQTFVIEDLGTALDRLGSLYNVAFSVYSYEPEPEGVAVIKKASELGQVVVKPISDDDIGWDTSPYFTS